MLLGPGLELSRVRLQPESLGDAFVLVKDKQNPAGASSSVGPVDPLRLSAGNETIASRLPRGSPGGVRERACTRRAACTATGNQTIAPRLGCREEEEEERGERDGGERGHRLVS